MQETPPREGRCEDDGEDETKFRTAVENEGNSYEQHLHTKDSKVHDEQG